jgi:hypothetical protein
VSPSDIFFSTRGVSPEERAAVEVVIDALVEEESAQEHAVSGGRKNSWESAQRGLRDGIEDSVNFGVDYTR